MPKIRAKTVDAYIKAAPPEARAKLKELRALLKKAAPRATEAIKWGSPVFEDGRILFAYAAFRSHLNFMPTPAAMKPFRKDLADLKTGMGSIQLPYDKPLPKALLLKIARYRVKDLKDNDAKWM